ncbi:hypothetical protein GCM10023148_43550 [Actinokineospora soli]
MWVLAGFLTACAGFAFVIVVPGLFDVVWLKAAGATPYLAVAMGAGIGGSGLMLVGRGAGEQFGKGLVGGALAGVLLFVAMVVVFLAR